MSDRTTIATIKRYFPFGPEEKKALLAQWLVFSFIFSYRDILTFDPTKMFLGIFSALVVVAITMFVHEIGHRSMGIKHGFVVEHKLWWHGLWIGLILALLSNGYIIFVAGHGVFIHLLAAHRLGHFRYGTNIFALAMTALAGPAIVIFLATFIKTFDVWFGLGVTAIPFFYDLFLFCWIYAFCNLLPIPPLDGSRVLYFSRYLYVFLIGLIGGYLVLVLFGIYSYIWALLIGFAVWLWYLVYG